MAQKNRAYDLESYSFSFGEQILIDANIWVYLYPPPSKPSSHVATSYSQAFKKLIDSKAQPILDPMIMSEYINRYYRIEWEASDKKRYKTFKNFRNSKDFASISSNAMFYGRKILEACKVHAVPANELNMDIALVDSAVGQIDFNDRIFINICKKQNLKLMTNDSDFQFGDIQVLTTNRQLLRNCE